MLFVCVCLCVLFPWQKNNLSWLNCQGMRELLPLLHSLAVKDLSPHNSGGAQHE